MQRYATMTLYPSGGARGPVILPAFKAGDSALRGSNGGFDSHTLPPLLHFQFDCAGILYQEVVAGRLHGDGFCFATFSSSDLRCDFPGGLNLCFSTKCTSRSRGPDSVTYCNLSQDIYLRQSIAELYPN